MSKNVSRAEALTISHFLNLRLTMRSLDQNYPAVEELTGDYHHDKLIYQNSVHSFLSSSFPQFQGGGLRIIEKYNGA